MTRPHIIATTLALVLSATAAQAATISLNTGVSSTGTVLGAGSLDPVWTISTDGLSFAAAKVGAVPLLCCGMESVASSAAWITSPSWVPGTIVTDWGIGPIVSARRTFDLSGLDLATVSLSGSWRVADYPWGIFINGTELPGTNLLGSYTVPGGYAWSVDSPFSVAAGSALFQDGINTIELRGASINSVYDGFWVSASVTGETITAAVPEPSTYALMAAGLLAVGVAARRRRI